MNKSIQTSIVLVLSMVMGCSEPDSKPEPTTRIMKYSDLGPPPHITMADIPDATLDPPQSRMIIKSGSLEGEVGNCDSAASHIHKIITPVGGFVISSSVNTVRGTVRRGSIQLRVPSTMFDSTLSMVSGTFSKVLSKSVSGNDVTEEFVDVTARLTNKKLLEERYRDILRSAKAVKDILDVEKELNEVRGEIERFEARRKYLEDQVGLSSISIALVEPQAGVENDRPSVWTKVMLGFQNGIHGFVNMLSLSITILIASIPIIIILSFVVYLAYKLITIYRSHRATRVSVSKSNN